jgi:hypothetical protein
MNAYQTMVVSSTSYQCGGVGRGTLSTRPKAARRAHLLRAYARKMQERFERWSDRDIYNFESLLSARRAWLPICLGRADRYDGGDRDF